MKKIFIVKSLKRTLILMATFLCAQNSFSQIAEPVQQEPNTEEAGPTSTETIKITRRVSSVSRGFRVQIYSGEDRNIAKSTKISFMKRFPSIRSYITYEVPYYKIKVGDFQSRKEANEFNKYLRQTYSTMVVPSLINNRIPPKVTAPKPQIDPAVEGGPAVDSAK